MNGSQARRRPHKAAGEQHYNARLTWADVRMIRHRRACIKCAGTLAEIAAAYGISSPMVYKIVAEQSWHPDHDPAPQIVDCPHHIVWHLDAVTDDGRFFLLMMVPASGHLSHVEMAAFDHVHLVAALNTMLVRAVPEWPVEIVTDHAVHWSKLADFTKTLGIRHRFTASGELTGIERAARALLANLPEDVA